MLGADKDATYMGKWSEADLPMAIELQLPGIPRRGEYVRFQSENGIVRLYRVDNVIWESGAWRPWIVLMYRSQENT